MFPRIFSGGTSKSNPIRLKGVRSTPLSDLYYFLMQARWSVVLCLFSASFLTLNAAFGLAYLAVGGVTNARPGNFADAFFFSVQTLGTIGYGGMVPASFAAHVLVTFESMVGMLALAMVTGLVFAKFSRPKARIVFSDVAIIAHRDGKPTLMFRVGNARANQLVEATLRVTLVRSERTTEGEPIRRLHDLSLVRSQSPAFVLTWTAMHVIDEKSALFNATAASLGAEGVEILVTFSAVDATLSQDIHARHSYIAAEIRWGHRFADVFSFDDSGIRWMDYSAFHQTSAVPKDPS